MCVLDDIVFVKKWKQYIVRELHVRLERTTTELWKQYSFTKISIAVWNPNLITWLFITVLLYWISFFAFNLLNLFNGLCPITTFLKNYKYWVVAVVVIVVMFNKLDTITNDAQFSYLSRGFTALIFVYTKSSFLKPLVYFILWLNDL